MARRAARIDRTALTLVETVKRLGCQWLPWPGGPIDGVLCRAGRVWLVDFKACATSPRTRRQKQLLTAGWPIHFLSTTEDVVAMLGTVARR